MLTLRVSCYIGESLKVVVACGLIHAGVNQVCYVAADECWRCDMSELSVGCCRVALIHVAVLYVCFVTCWRRLSVVTY